MNAPDRLLWTRLDALEMASPVMLAAGTAGTLDEMGDVLDLSKIGAVVTKSITAEPREGNATWRVIESDVGMLNAIGLANIGMEAFGEQSVPRIASMPCAVVVSIAGSAIEDYVRVATRLAGGGQEVRAIELNVSCPNVHGGTQFGADPVALSELVKAVRAAASNMTLLVKLSPITIGTPHSMVDLARSAIDAGADVLTLANTLPAMAIDVEKRTPRLANITGGLSGPAVHPVTLKLVYDVYRQVAKDAGVPLVGVGGVSTWRDAAEFVLAGASAVQIGTALFAHPKAALRINAGLAKWVRRQGAASLSELVGAMRLEERET